MMLAVADAKSDAIDVELREVDVKNVFRLLSEISGKNVLLDDCVHGKLDIKLANAPVPLVFDAIALEMHLAYEERDGFIYVRCADGDAAAADDERLAARVTIDVRDATLESVLAHVVEVTKLDGVDRRATAKPIVTTTMKNVRAATALAALSESSGVRLRAQSGQLVVEDR